MVPPRLNKRATPRAAPNTSEKKALWYLGDGLGVFAGPLLRNQLHTHCASVFLAGIYGSFQLRIGNGKWHSCRSAVIPAGTAYEFDMHGEPLAVLYLEPSLAPIDALIGLCGDHSEEGGALIGQSGETLGLREIYEHEDSTHWADEALESLIAYSQNFTHRQIDARILEAMRVLQHNSETPTPVANVAKTVGLSASRFQHLFTAEVGVPFRRYRSWQRLRAAIKEVTQGSNLTTAAHAAGFCDQAHFARSFRNTFGAPATPSLSNIR